MCVNSDIDICLNRKMCDLEYAADVVLLSKNSSKMQVFFGNLNDSVGMFRISIAPSYTVPRPDRLKSSLVPAGAKVRWCR